MPGMSFRPQFAVLLSIIYLATGITAAKSPSAFCLALDAAPPAAHSHDNHANQHHHGSGTGADGCLKCCLGACLVAPGLPGPHCGVSQLAFVGVPVLYWGGSSRIVGHHVAPEPGPPKPIT